VLQCLQNTPLEGDVAEHLVPADRTPEELEQCFAVAVDDVQAHLWIWPV